MPLPQPLQLPPAHGAFLGHPIETLGKDMEFGVLGQQFDLNALAGLLPRLVQQVLLQTTQASLGRADGIVQFCRRPCTAQRTHEFRVRHAELAIIAQQITCHSWGGQSAAAENMRCSMRFHLLVPGG
jgi:hypothetical protein